MTNQNNENEEPHSVRNNGSSILDAREARNIRRDRGRAIAEREASRLARPESTIKSKSLLNTKKVQCTVKSSTPSGVKSYDEVEEWCGPFSVAKQMIAAREEARKKLLREKDQEEGQLLTGLFNDLDQELKIKKNPSQNWCGNVGTIRAANSCMNNLYMLQRKRYKAWRRLKFPSLFFLCVQKLVENFDHVESLGSFVDSSIRKVITDELIQKGKLNGAAFDVLTEDGIEVLEITDCSMITQDQLAEVFTRLVPQGLRAIILNNAGRCFGPKAVEAIINGTSSSSSVFALSIGGGYLLNDTLASKLISITHPSSLELKTCPLLGAEFCRCIGTTYSNETLLELLLEDLSVTKEDFMTIQESKAFKNLQQLKLSRVDCVDDEVIKFVLESSNELSSIVLDGLDNVSDESLFHIRNCNSNDTLRVLNLESCRNITSIGLELLFTTQITTVTGMNPPPRLSSLNLSRCQANAVTDEVLDFAIEASIRKKKLNQGEGGGLVYLNIAESPSITDTTMEKLASCCSRLLQELNISFCPKISNKGLGYLVSKVTNQLNKIEIWGNAQISEEFLDGHDRVMKRGNDDEGLEIVGVWFKKRKIDINVNE